MEQQEVKTWIIIGALISVAFGSVYILNNVLTDDDEKTGPITIVDDLDRTVTLNDSADRVVSLTQTNTEILFEIDAGDKIVGRDEYSDYPEEALDIPTVGGSTNPSVEEILAVDPDAIVAHVWAQDALLIIEDQIPTLYFQSESINDVLNTIERIGKVIGKNSEAENVIDNLQSRIAAITDITDDLTKAEKPKVYYEVWTLMSVSSMNYENEMISIAGGINIAENESIFYPTLNTEYIINENPEIIVFLGGHGSYGETIEGIKNRDGWDAIPAVINDKVYEIEGDLTNPGPRIVDGIEYLAYYFHPDKFPEPVGLTSILSSVSINSL